MYRESFPSKIRKARNNTGFTQKEVEKETGIKQSTLTKYENGTILIKFTLKKVELLRTNNHI